MLRKVGQVPLHTISVRILIHDRTPLDIPIAQCRGCDKVLAVAWAGLPPSGAPQFPYPTRQLS